MRLAFSFHYTWQPSTWLGTDLHSGSIGWANCKKAFGTYGFCPLVYSAKPCLPEKQPLTFYLCCGKKPPPTVDQLQTKVNFVSIYLQLFCLGIHLFVTTKLNISQYKLDKNHNTTTFFRFIFTPLQSSMLVFTLGLNFVVLLSVMSKANSLKMSEVTIFPNYYYIHGLLIIYPVFTTNTLTTMFFVKNKDMLDVVLLQFKKWWNRCWHMRIYLAKDLQKKAFSFDVKLIGCVFKFRFQSHLISLYPNFMI